MSTVEVGEGTENSRVGGLTECDVPSGVLSAWDVEWESVGRSGPRVWFRRPACPAMVLAVNLLSPVPNP